MALDCLFKGSLVLFFYGIIFSEGGNEMEESQKGNEPIVSHLDKYLILLLLF
jgi:hypothetical protein